MKVKQTIILVIILLLLGFTAYILKKPFSAKTSTQEAPVSQLFPKIKKDRINKIEVRLMGKLTVLEKKGEKWLVSSEKDYPAEQKNLEELVAKLEQLSPGDIISQNTEKQNIFQVDQSGAEVKIYDAQGAPLAYFFVGKNGPDFKSTFVRLDGSEKVYDVSENLRSFFHRPDWRDKSVLAFAAEEVAKLELEKENETITFSKNEKDNWEIVKPATYPVKPQMVTGMVNFLANLKANEFVDLTSLDGVQTGLASPSLKVKVGLRNGTEKVLALGQENDQKLTYVQRFQDNQGFLVPTNRFLSFKRSLDEFKDKSLLEFKPEQVVKMSFHEGQTESILEKDAEAGWKKSGSGEGLANSETVEQLLKTWSNLRAEDVVGKGNFSNYESEKSPVKVTIYLQNNVSQALVIGKEKENSGYYVRKEPGEYVYILSKANYEVLQKTFQ